MYKRTVVKTELEYKELLEHIIKAKGWLAFDTETTGLHLKKDTPFLLTLTFDGCSYALDLEKWEVSDIITLFDNMEHFEFVIGHNVKYDLHMLENIGIRYPWSNLADTMVFARLALDTDATMTLALKALSKKYLYAEAGEDEKRIKRALTALKRGNTTVLKSILREHGKTKKWFDTLTKDTIFETSDLGDFEKPYLEYLKEYPDPTYKDVYLDPDYTVDMLVYAMLDTELTLELAKKMYPTLLARDQKSIFDRECELILPLYRMERVGLKIDREYLEECQIKTKRYIIERRKLLEECVGEPIKVGQHKRIKDIFKEKWSISLQSSDDKALSTVDGRHAKIAAGIIRELRTIEKWYSAYILRLQDKSAYDGRAYTQIKQATAITGRVSSDFQQFPKYGIRTISGDELFHPRRAIRVTGDNYKRTYYLDYSQIELRVQADYTYQISGGDMNMCRAYMPFKCHDEKGNAFVPKEDTDIIFSKKWFLDENNELWHPVDLHGATTTLAFPDLEVGTKEFTKARALGKAANFAKNYGATTKALMEQFGMDKVTAEKLNNAYYAAFPKILDYQKVVTDTYRRRGYVRNRYGRRYYLSNSRFVYKLYNYIIQGTSADLLKEKIIEVDRLLQPYRSRFQMNIHDELSFEIYDGEEFLIPALKHIMEDVEWMVIPVVADVEITDTTWADKIEEEKYEPSR